MECMKFCKNMQGTLHLLSLNFIIGIQIRRKNLLFIHKMLNTQKYQMGALNFIKKLKRNTKQLILDFILCLYNESNELFRIFLVNF